MYVTLYFKLDFLLTMITKNKQKVTPCAVARVLHLTHKTIPLRKKKVQHKRSQSGTLPLRKKKKIFGATTFAFF